MKKIITTTFLLLTAMAVQAQELEAVNDINWKWGYIDNSKLVIPFQYHNALPFHEGLAGVNLNDQWGFIDKTGKRVK